MAKTYLIISQTEKKEIAMRLKAGALFKRAVTLTIPHQKYHLVLHYFRVTYDVYSTRSIVGKILSDKSVESD